MLSAYSAAQNQKQTAAEQAKPQAATQAQTDKRSLKEAEAAAEQADGQPKTLSAQANADGSTSAQQSPGHSADSSVLNVIHSPRFIDGGQLIFSPANLTVSLGGTMPTLTISSPDGAAISAPTVTGNSSTLRLTSVRPATKNAQAAWQMELTGKPVLGLYHLNLQATSQTNTTTTTYTGVLTVLVIL
jgi:hypothetical protein